MKDTKELRDKIIQTLKIVSLALVLSFGISIIYAAPTQNPPNGNTPEPINAGVNNQVKTGGILEVFNFWVNSSMGVTGGATFGGNVGIGTTTPNNSLDIYSASKPAIGFSGIGDSSYKWTLGMDVANGGGFVISSSTSLGTNARFVISGNGNVGIGTTSPEQSLSVNGPIYSGTGGFKFPDGNFQTIAVKTNQALFNTSIGDGTLPFNTTGNNNTAFGAQALYLNTTGSYNTAYGMQALYYNYTSSNNTATGYAALRLNNGSYNTANGVSALTNNTGGLSNTAIGAQTLQANTTGSYNTATGNFALYANTTGNYNTAIGINALANNTGSAANDNTAIGSLALRFNTTGYSNTANGKEALRDNTTGANNTSIGVQSLHRNTTGNNNTAIGGQALYINTTGSSNTAIGSAANVSTAALSNATAIGYGAVVNASNKVRIGDTLVTVIEGQVGWSATSDERLKKNIEEYTHGLDFISKLRPVTFKFKSDDTEKVHSGFLAQEVEAIKIPFYGLNRPEGNQSYYTLSYSEFVVPLVNAVKELKVFIDDIYNRLTKNDEEISLLKKENSELRARIEKLETILLK